MIDLRELENAKDEEELLTKFSKIAAEAYDKIGEYRGITKMYDIITKNLSDTADIAGAEIKRGNKSAIAYINIGEKTLKEVDEIINKAQNDAHKVAHYAENAQAIKNLKLQEFKIGK